MNKRMSESVKISATESHPATETASPVHDRLSRLIFGGLCVIVVLAPLPLGSARPLAWDVLALAVALLLLSTLILPTIETSIWREGLFLPTLLFAIVIGYALIQTVPLAPARLRNPIWDEATDILGNGVYGSIAADRGAALIYILRLLSYAGIFYLSVIMGRDAHRARVGVRLVALSGCLYGVYGLLVYWSGNRTILWYPKWAYEGDLTGPFVNHNSFATYLGLCALAALTLTLESFARLHLRGDLRQRLAQAIEFISKRSLSLLTVFILFTALLLTHSRGGLAATIGGIMILLLAITFAPGTGRLRRVGVWSIGPCVLILLIAFFISSGATLNRFLAADVDSNTRLLVDQLTFQAIKDYPFLGIGLGSFASVFQIYRTEAIRFYFDLAHNDYLQNVLELGIPAALCLFVAMGCLVGLCIHGIRTRLRDAIFPCLGLAASGLVALHATIDFSLQIPAVTVVYLFLLGIAVAQSVSSRVKPVRER
jgi:O-antigen ligase